MSTVGQMHLLDNLQSLLEKQIETARKGNLRRLEALAKQTDSVVEELGKTKTFDLTEFGGQRKDIVKLYKKLELILETGKDTIDRQLRQAGNVQKTLKAYRNNG